MLNAAFKSQPRGPPANRTTLINTDVRLPLATLPAIVGARDERRLGLPKDYHDVVRQHLRAQMPMRRFTSVVGPIVEPSNNNPTPY